MNWKQRVLRELLQLTERITLLQTKLDIQKEELLVKQCEVMMQYQDILMKRLDDELEDK